MTNREIAELPMEEGIIKFMQKQIKLWFAAFCIAVTIAVVEFVGFMWYLSLPSEYVQIKNDSGNANYVGNDLNGTVVNGEHYSNQEDDTQETRQ